VERHGLLIITFAITQAGTPTGEKEKQLTLCELLSFAIKTVSPAVGY